ncbi:D-alanyl-D-alanine carboxypeptidase/D-alanyl-D-alanine endopeptidase [Guptibacillus hwajinpoensis]|uniref:D-alanyl-D-alanine carboxypeptidase/D-alanyl-D-alanine endopeptidase n=1 Tax=Guptibacillus hwajinpoensis TaxID=208199 RepID=UPI001CFE1819|nr:D-alanyl-D-alanine carboxypeptidase/D-alanyl-D-alanine-endopeptidase [Pseudalkalibacillus hwajinpoensis]
MNQSTLHKVLNDKRLEGAIAGVSVRSARTGAILFNQFGNTRLTPASNMKLLTAAAALHTLGPDYCFTTEICTDGIIHDGELIGNLYLRGKGDPTLLPKDLEKFALELQSLGVRRIQGDLVGDESWFDAQYLSEDMIWSDEHEYYGAQISALTISPNTDYDAGTIMLTILSEGEIGESPEFMIFPKTHYVEVVNLATIVSSKEEGDLRVKRNHGSNTITITGTVSQYAAPEKKWIAVWNPATYALEVFSETLVSYGITLSGNKVLAQTPDHVKTLLTKTSMPLSELLITFMKLSNNGHAEVLIKEMGRLRKGEGSFEAGLEVVKMFLKGEGLNPDNMCLRDGSGISQMNLIQPNELSMLLFKLQNKSWFPTFLNSLPIAGSPERLVGGTLRERFGGTSAENIVFAKTGSLIGVTSLSGYIKKEEPLIFSIMINHFLDEEETEKIEDEIMLVLSGEAL